MTVTTSPARAALLRAAGEHHRRRRFAEAEALYREVLAGGDEPLALINLGHLQHFRGRLSEAVTCRRRALALCPEDAGLRADLGESLIFLGAKDEGITLLRQAVETAPERADLHSRLLFRLHHLPHLDPEALYAEHRLWARRHAPSTDNQRAWDLDRDPDRPLRVGYVSADLRSHPVACFVEALLDGHDPERTVPVAYANVACPDAVTERLRGKFAAWHAIADLDDATAAARIRADRIDILIDLHGHTPGHRLGIFARRAAPIQGTYLGYPDTTGLEALDVRLVDPWSSPAWQQAWHSERLVPLPRGFLSYRAPEAAAQAGPARTNQRGGVTFGMVNNTSKVQSPMLDLWARILASVPNARLLIKSRAGDDPAVRAQFLRALGDRGLRPERIDVLGQLPQTDYFSLFHEIDVLLDTFPYNGTTTTCDALWMGVPVVSLVGDHHASRVGLSLLSQVGLADLAASDPADYVAKAVALAGRPDLRAGLRAGLRRRMQAGVLGDPRAFSGDVEGIYRGLWRDFLARSARNGR